LTDASGTVVPELLAAGASAQEKDVPGSKDHPLISRYAGSVIVGYDTKEYDELVLPLAGIFYDENINQAVPAKSQKVEGKLTRILYLAPEGRSTLEIFRNYENELKRAGFQVLYSCSGDKGCGERGDLMYQFIYPQERQLRNLPDLEYVFSFPKNQRYLAAKLARPDGDVYVSLYMAVNDFDIPQWMYQRITVLLEVVEAKPMEAGMVKVDASAMAKDIATAGRVAIYGIYFDTDKADLKPESKPTLAEIAKLLKQDPALKLYVVGHTDGVGSLEHNMDLSRRRAEATVKTLVSEYGVDPKRLKPFGVGPLAPMASNDTEQGRAKNRRVELVKQ
jgi:outer membrane protein OmpA-like peptidoglycan-associated protein